MCWTLLVYHCYAKDSELKTRRQRQHSDEDQRGRSEKQTSLSVRGVDMRRTKQMTANKLARGATKENWPTSTPTEMAPISYAPVGILTIR
jgi:hypothetical protein